MGRAPPALMQISITGAYNQCEVRSEPENKVVMTNIILDYNTMWGQGLGDDASGLPAGWEITGDHRYLREAVALVFHIPSLRQLPSGKPKDQVWVAWSMEAEANYPQLTEPSFMRWFDLAMTYRLDSDIPVPYNCFYGAPTDFIEALYRPAKRKHPERLAVLLVSSPHNKSGRLDYARELMRHLDVHSYGRQLSNRVFPRDEGRISKLEMLSGYHFTLAMENAIGEDYVTEKFFDPLICGSVPVYLGAPNIGRFSPGEHCFVDVTDYPTPRTLADRLKELAADGNAYRAYFDWKTRPLRAEFLEWLEPMGVSPLQRLVEKIQEFRDAAGKC